MKNLKKIGAIIIALVVFMVGVVIPKTAMATKLRTFNVTICYGSDGNCLNTVIIRR